jgi:acyl-homoserine lactone acylase PvdQ
VAGEAPPRSFTVQLSHHGPIVARAPGKAYAAALAYADEVGYLESKYWFMVAEDYRGAIKALEVRQIMPQNVMVADTAGNIYYQRTGRVPIRPDGYDWSRPVDGSTSATAWRGIHPVEDLISLLNPEQGYMENNNVGPDTMLVGSPLQPSRYLPYLYNQPALHTHQRGSSALAQLDAVPRFDRESFKRLALDDHVYQSERWIAELARAAAAPGRALGDTAKTMLERLRAWDGRSSAGSNGALLYYAFRHALVETAGKEKARALAAQIDDYLAPLRSAPGFEAPLPPGHLAAAEDRALLVQALEAGAVWMSRRAEGLDATFGDHFRAGRLDASDDVSWPVGGGTLQDEGIATVRSIGFGAERADGTRWGERGQTSTEVVFLTTPIESFTQPPIGQSDRPDSPHYRDQLEKLLSPARLKPTWFEEAELRQGHIRSEERVTYRPRTE